VGWKAQVQFNQQNLQKSTSTWNSTTLLLLVVVEEATAIASKIQDRSPTSEQKSSDVVQIRNDLEEVEWIQNNTTVSNIFGCSIILLARGACFFDTNCAD
jgi:hypothetical protein